MTTHKTPEQIAEETLRHEYGLTVEDYPTAEDAMQKVLDVADDQTAADLLDTIAKAVEADRAQRNQIAEDWRDDQENVRTASRVFVSWAAYTETGEVFFESDMELSATQAVGMFQGIGEASTITSQED